MGYYFYIVNCSDNTWYTGFTTSVEQRLAAHNAGRGAKYTKARRPVSLVASAKFETKREALQAEYYFKRLNREQKEELVKRASASDLADELVLLVQRITSAESEGSCLVDA